MLIGVYVASCFLVLALMLFGIWWRGALSDDEEVIQDDIPLIGFIIFIVAATWPIMLIGGGIVGFFYGMGWLFTRAARGRRR